MTTTRPVWTLGRAQQQFHPPVLNEPHVVPYADVVSPTTLDQQIGLWVVYREASVVLAPSKLKLARGVLLLDFLRLSWFSVFIAVDIYLFFNGSWEAWWEASAGLDTWRGSQADESTLSLCDSMPQLTRVADLNLFLLQIFLMFGAGIAEAPLAAGYWVVGVRAYRCEAVELYHFFYGFAPRLFTKLFGQHIVISLCAVMFSRLVGPGLGILLRLVVSLLTAFVPPILVWWCATLCYTSHCPRPATPLFLAMLMSARKVVASWTRLVVIFGSGILLRLLALALFVVPYMSAWSSLLLTAGAQLRQPTNQHGAFCGVSSCVFATGGSSGDAAFVRGR